METSTDDMTLLYLGSGLTGGGMLLGLIAAIIFCANEKNKGFRYGAFFLGGSLAMVPLFGLGTCCYYYQFLDVSMASMCSIITVSVIVGVLAAFKFLDFRSKALFWIVNIPYILIMYGIPLWIFNMVYLYAIYKPPAAPPGLPEPAA